MCGYYQNKYRIESSRCRNWDYGSPGYYFITICTENRQWYFGYISNKIFIPSKIGQHTIDCWKSMPDFHPFISLDEFTLMPDHLHGIVKISSTGSENQDIKSHVPNRFGPQLNNLAVAIRGLKMAVTSYAKSNHIDFRWQPRFHDHIIRDDAELLRIRKYIYKNPRKWGKPGIINHHV